VPRDDFKSKQRFGISFFVMACGPRDEKSLHPRLTARCLSFHTSASTHRSGNLMQHLNHHLSTDTRVRDFIKHALPAEAAPTRPPRTSSTCPSSLTPRVNDDADSEDESEPRTKHKNRRIYHLATTMAESRLGAEPQGAHPFNIPSIVRTRRDRL
jgi:hypothetical protein